MEQNNLEIKTEEKEYLDTLVTNRLEFIKAMKKNKMEGIQDVVTELYQSKGHFVYELIQNAEDAQATNVFFNYNNNTLQFIHDGKKLFSIKDIDSITCLGNSTKKDDGNSIGKFGVGFKSVFEYTEKPLIESGKFKFTIENLFLPNLQPVDKFIKNTIITLPLGSASKTPEECRNEIFKTLESLPYDTLLFLKNIKNIKSQFDNNCYNIERNEEKISENCCLCSIRFWKNKDPAKTRQFLRVTKQILVYDKKQKENIKIDISIAYKLKLDKIGKYKLCPILDKINDEPNGKVYTFLACPGEKSKLCFHIQAPFALPPNREVLKQDDESNQIIIDNLADLMCESITFFRAHKLIDSDLFNVLPNEIDDKMSSKYEVFINKIQNLFNLDNYTPMEYGSYAPAKDKFLDRNSMRKVISDDFLNRLYETTNKSYWIKSSGVKGRSLHFLQTLNSKEYQLHDLFNQLLSLSENKTQILLNNLFEFKDIKWLNSFYNCAKSDSSNMKDFFKDLPLCFCKNNKFEKSKNCYLENNNCTTDSNINIINNDIFTLKKNEDENLKDFFIYELGLKEYNEKIKIEKKIESYNQSDNKKIEDILEFFKLYKTKNETIKDGANLDLLDNYGNWHKSYQDNLFFPNEYKTPIKNLNLYYEGIYNKNSAEYYKKYPLSTKYLDIISKDELADFISFLSKSGVISTLQIEETDCYRNEHWRKIKREAEGSLLGNSTPTNEDYNIIFLDELLTKLQNEDVFKLIWTFLENQPIAETIKDYCSRNYLKEVNYSICKYRTAKKYPLKEYSSQLVNILKESSWIIQLTDESNYNFVTPKNAINSKLPKYARQSYVTNANLRKWLKALEFETESDKEVAEQNQVNAYLKKRNIDPLIIQKLQQLQLSFSEEELNQKLNNFLESLQIDVADYESDDIDIERLKNKTKENYNNASDISYKKTILSKREDSTILKQEALEYLNLKYNVDNIFNCQLCHEVMPFKKPDNSYYFEVTQLFDNKLFPKNLKENRIALCPICAAKMKVYFRSYTNKQKELFEKIIYSRDEITNFKITLDKDYILKFELAHITALKQELELIKKEKDLI